MISLKAQRSSLLQSQSDVTAIFLPEDDKQFRHAVKNLKRDIPSLKVPLEAAPFAGKEQETLTVYPAELKGRALVLVGIGKYKKLSLEKIRRAAATAVTRRTNAKASSIALLRPDLDPESFGSTWEDIGTAIAEGAILALYRFDKYFTEERNARKVREIVLLSDPQLFKAIKKGVDFASVVCRSVYLARDLENAPANEIYPETLAKRAKKIARASRFAIRIFDHKKIKQMKMGGLLGVAQGSEKSPRFLVMDYRGKGARATVALVGKGVTFDAGGISIKPSSGMAEMKMDMSGAAAVIATMQATARLKLPVHLIGLTPITENLLGGSAMKPGDILTHYNGKTSEVDNTDAEGRLILADALAYASKFKPDLVIDLATLTGACVVALGHYATGMMGNDEEAMQQLKEAGERTYERVWQLPMFEEYEKLVKSDVADVKNVGGRWGGAITAAMFLKKFIGNYRWVHLDIAGTAILEESLDYIPKGGSGVGVRLLIDFFKHYKA